MSGWLIVVVGVIYAGIAVDSLLKGNTPQAVVFAGYAFSNAGLYIMSKGTP